VQELSNMLYTLLLKGMEHPTAIRYPREAEVISLDEVLSSMKEIALWKWEEIMHGEEGAILATGSMVSRSYEVALNYGYALYNCRSIKPLDESMLEYVFGKYDTIVCVEEGIKRGGFGSGIALKAIEHGYAGKIDLVAIDDCFSPHGTRDEILSELGLDTRGIEKTISRLRGEKNASDYGIR